MTRNQAIAANCRDCIHDPLAAGTWREQVAVCGCTDCHLWPYRPLPANAPARIKSREAGDLPSAFGSLCQDEAVALLRSNANAKPDGCAVQAIRDVCGAGTATHVAGETP